MPPSRERARAAFSTTGSLPRVAPIAPADPLPLLETSTSGLSSAEAAARLEAFGPNTLAAHRRLSLPARIVLNLRDPLSLLLALLGVVACFTEDLKTTMVIGAMLVLSVGLRLLQEFRADHAAEKLTAMVRTTATAVRDGLPTEVSFAALVPGDVLELNAGDLVPADVRLLESRDLSAN